ncbi:hypothetical protein K7X08_032512 [Anisodus acutangulus]|uniref:Uncharacterized protein n=1 Tax=Anisodus acutangulus TaxID=402998 RepID=A0A9Q1LMK4_9SOLA|nr:hypothetical protein K7X08_032512 [Anisodus acutangulus]
MGKRNMPATSPENKPQSDGGKGSSQFDGSMKTSEGISPIGSTGPVTTKMQTRAISEIVQKGPVKGAKVQATPSASGVNLKEGSPVKKLSPVKSRAVQVKEQIVERMMETHLQGSSGSKSWAKEVEQSEQIENVCRKNKEKVHEEEASAEQVEVV